MVNLPYDIVACFLRPAIFHALTILFSDLSTIQIYIHICIGCHKIQGTGVLFIGPILEVKAIKNVRVKSHRRRLIFELTNNFILR